jgi:AcrR family transcriptional regulator
MSTRDRLIDATEQIIRTEGILAVSTKEIAKRAGFAEATIYRHFQDKTELLLSVFQERLPEGLFLVLIRDLPGYAGQGTVEGNLTQLADAAVTFFSQTAPLNVALAADPELHKRHWSRLRELGTGPEFAFRAVAAYLRAEQDLGRVHANARPEAVSTLLLGTCFNYAQVRDVMDTHPYANSHEQFVSDTIQALMTGLNSPSQ